MSVYSLFSPRLLFSLALVALASCLFTATVQAADSETATGNEDARQSVEPAFAGSGLCQQCHQEEYRVWQQSDHHRAFASANSETVRGDFGDVEVAYTDGKALFSQNEAGQFLITLHTKAGRESYPVLHTLGHYPLQQYLLETAPGNYQVFALAWDTRPVNQGGQRWFEPLTGEVFSPDNPFHWKNYFQNWNSQCATCHVTNFEKGYVAPASENTAAYNSTWSEAGVGCEACHGPGSAHISWANDGGSAQGNGLITALENPLRWQFKAGDPIAKQVPAEPSNSLLNTTHTTNDNCVRCHSLRHPLDERPFETIASDSVSNSFADHFDPQGVVEPLYFADGQIREEAFVYGSFLQSKMHNAGVTCSNCHNAHSGKVIQFDASDIAKPQNDGVCAQCHQPDVFAVEQHHHHPVETEAARCVTCHMPERTYMTVDPRRDHSFSVPSPDLSEFAGTPNVCTECHQAQTESWAAESINAWRESNDSSGAIKQDFAAWQLSSVKAQAEGDQRQIVLAEQQRHQLLALADTPVMKRAMLINAMPVYDAPSFQALAARLSDDHAVVRLAAVERAAEFDPATRQQLLLPLLDDAHLSVRLRATLALADLLQQAGFPEEQLLQQRVAEFIEAYRKHEDLVTSQVKLAAIYRQLADYEQSTAAYVQALKLVPGTVPNMINLADNYRVMNRDPEGEQLLLSAIQSIKDSAAFLDSQQRASAQLQQSTVHYSLGLLYIRTKESENALKQFATAVELNPQDGQSFYAYLLTLDSLGRREDAMEQLKSSDLVQQSQQLQQLLRSWQTR